MTLQQKWDLLWPYACRVAHAIERYDNERATIGELQHRERTLASAARELQDAVDFICPREPK